MHSELKNELILLVACVFTLGFFTGVCVYGFFNNSNMEKQAIERGLMRHNPETGKKEWIEKQ